MPPPRLLKLGPLPPNTFHPPKGQKQIFLPNFTLTLLRTPHSPPTWASFIVPLWLNKLDLKDYLFHAYNLRTLQIRSYVQQSKMTEGRPGDRRASSRQFFRPRATKRMTVELAHAPGSGPFQWPAEIEDYAPWQRARGAMEAQEEELGKVRRREERGLEAKRDGEVMAQQAKSLRSGEVEWMPGWKMGGFGGRDRREEKEGKKEGKEGEAEEEG